jgi:uncharacterized membrane protein YeaQ/YmgE (transglycosylase-associated protein family)
MNISRFVVQLVVAIVCAGIGNILIPRQIPGKVLGLIIIGLLGVWLGEWGFGWLNRQYGLDHAILRWQIQGVSIVPSVIGSAIVIYVVTTLLRWGKYRD